jgi:hypothetical protein
MGSASFLILLRLLRVAHDGNHVDAKDTRQFQGAPWGLHDYLNPSDPTTKRASPQVRLYQGGSETTQSGTGTGQRTVGCV